MLASLEGNDTRTQALERYRSAGWTANDFARVRAAREMLADSLARTEDMLERWEADHRRHAPRTAEREAIKAVRRRLELELWA